MAIPKVCGLDTEYILTWNRADESTVTAARALLNAARDVLPHTTWNPEGELPVDVRTDNPVEPSASDTRTLDADSDYGVMLFNAARLYVDHGHIEYATPEARTPRDVIACDKAGELVLEQAMTELSGYLPPDQTLRLYKHNADAMGNSVGAHENYLMPASVYDTLMRVDLHKIESCLIPFLVTRQLYCGAGKVTRDSGVSGEPYQLSQRADFFETVYGLQTMNHRPIINTRNEPHANRARYRRWHIIIGDANMADRSALLKIGTTQLVLSMLEDDALPRDLTLEDPVAALHHISSDVTCQQPVRLVNGARITAVEIQFALIDAAEQYLEANPDPVYAEIIRLWRETVTALAADPMQMAHCIDWVIKRAYILDQLGAALSDVRAQAFDYEYHRIDRAESPYYLLREGGLIEALIDDAAVQARIERPADGTRAAPRAAMLRAHADKLVSASWESITVRAADGSVRRHAFPEPIPAEFAAGAPV